MLLLAVVHLLLLQSSRLLPLCQTPMLGKMQLNVTFICVSDRTHATCAPRCTQPFHELEMEHALNAVRQKVAAWVQALPEADRLRCDGISSEATADLQASFTPDVASPGDNRD
jgi:hypothetical protein